MATNQSRERNQRIRRDECGILLLPSAPPRPACSKTANDREEANPLRVERIREEFFARIVCVCVFVVHYDEIEIEIKRETDFFFFNPRTLHRVFREIEAPTQQQCSDRTRETRFLKSYFVLRFELFRLILVHSAGLRPHTKRVPSQPCQIIATT